MKTAQSMQKYFIRTSVRTYWQAEQFY